MEKILNLFSVCSLCGAGFELESIIINFKTCEFIVQVSCINCGSPERIILSLEDFIQLNKWIEGKDITQN